jgi:hypothetical protein
LLRGKVEHVRNTTNQFFLDGTSIPLVSKALSLEGFVGMQTIMQVVNIGTRTRPTLDVRSAALTAKMFDMGNLRFGRAEVWQVNAAWGSSAVVYANAMAATSYLPVGAWGTWLLGPAPLRMASGVVSNLGQFRFRFTMPRIPALVGVAFTAQAVVQDKSGRITLSNADSKEVRSK